jgi:hypothetical protein
MKENNIEKDEKKNVILALGKIAVDGYYDYQQIRISQKNRVRDIVRRKIEGIPLDKPEEKIEDKKYKEKFKDKNLPKFLGELVLEGKITDIEKQYIEKIYKISAETEKTEMHYKKLMDQYLEEEEIWYGWLSKIKGISGVLGSNLLKNFGYCENYQYVSSLWRHTGFDPAGAKGLAGATVGEDGKKHIHYSPKLKTMVWKISDSFFKQRTPPYRGIYDAVKRKELALMEQYGKGVLVPDHIDGKTTCKNGKHVEFRAKRNMVKIFLQHYWRIGRLYKGLLLLNHIQ